MNKNKHKSTSYLFKFTSIDWSGLVLLFVLISISLPRIAGAAPASLFLSPPSATYNVGATFSVKVKINTGGETINAAEGTLDFNPQEISVKSISKSDSIFTLWTSEPTFSNSEGNIVFGGGTHQNFTGASGTIMTITFSAIISGSAQVGFSAGAVLAADGKGTNILTSMNGGTYTLAAQVIAPPAGPTLPPETPPQPEYTSPTVSGRTPAAPVISSSTHADSEKWYSNRNPEFSWKIPSDVTAVKLLLGKTATALPTVLYSPAISNKKIENLADGVWYFHVQFKNQYGWGEVSHRKVLIDTEPPEPFKIIVDRQGDLTNPSPILHFETTDSLSQVQYYEVKIEEVKIEELRPENIKTNPYKMPPQAPGTHKIVVTAVDSALNSTSATSQVRIEPIEKPVITDFPKTLQPGDTLTIKGTSLLPDAEVTVFLQKESQEPIKRGVKTDGQGNWLFSYDKKLEKGTYQFWVEITDSRGAKSEPTEKISIDVALPSFLRTGGMAIGYLAIIVTLVILIAVLVGVIFYIRYRISLWRKRLKKETQEAEEVLGDAFKFLKKEIEEQIAELDGRIDLTQREQKIYQRLKEVLKKSKKIIGKEISDIKKELK